MASFAESHGHARDEGDFEALYSTYRADVQRLASYLLRNASDAEDAAQTVFLNVLRALRQGVNPADPRAWLLAITRNVCFSRHRAAAARPVQVGLEPDDAPAPTEDETPSADEIVGALARMLPNQRTALILRDFRGVSRAEICDLMALSTVAVEAMLTRARTAFREELEAGAQPFECAETRALVEQQLDGMITVADRHSLRSHLRHCSPCSSLARAVRSSRGKLAGVVFWPVDLISRLVAAFSQAPTAVHVATAITSTAAVATIALPVAVSNGPTLAHVEGRAASGPAAAVAAPARPALAASAAARPALSTPTAVRAGQPVSSTATWHVAADTAAADKAGVREPLHSGPATRNATPKSNTSPWAAAPPPTAPTTDRPATTSVGSEMPTHSAPLSPTSIPSDSHHPHDSVSSAPATPRSPIGTAPSIPRGSIRSAPPTSQGTVPSAPSTPHRPPAAPVPNRSSGVGRSDPLVSPAAKSKTKGMLTPRLKPNPSRKSSRRGETHRTPGPTQAPTPTQPGASASGDGIVEPASDTSGAPSQAGPSSPVSAATTPPRSAINQSSNTKTGKGTGGSSGTSSRH